METKLAKLSATLEADQSLDRMVQNANENFSGGRVTKTQLLSWILVYFEKTRYAELKSFIQRDHFDQMTYLESLLGEMKRARKMGQSSPDLASILSELTSARGGEK